jgi:hypothetical protein
MPPLRVVKFVDPHPYRPLRAIGIAVALTIEEFKRERAESSRCSTGCS